MEQDAKIRPLEIKPAENGCSDKTETFNPVRNGAKSDSEPYSHAVLCVWK